MMAAQCKGKMVLSLSGNPGAAIIGLFCVAMPYVKKLQGITDVLPESMKLVLKHSYGKPSPKQRFVRGRMLVEDGVAYFVENDKQGNGVVSSFIGCDVLAEIPAGSDPVEKGEKITAYRM